MVTKEQLKAIEFLVCSGYNLTGLRAYLLRLHGGYMIPPEDAERLGAEMIQAGVVLAKVPDEVVMEYIAAYRAGWNDMSDHEQLLDTLRNLYREGSRARAEHDLNEKTP